MTETIVQEAPASAPSGDAPGTRRTVLIAGALVAALALGGGGYLLLSGGSSDQELGAVPKGKPRTSLVTKNGAPAVEVKPAVQSLPRVSTIRIGRDPFKPLYVEPAEAPAAAPAAPTTTDSTGSGSTGGASTGGTAPTAPTSYALKLQRTYGSGDDKTAVFTVDGKTMVAKIGSTFGPTSEIRLLSLGQTPKGVDEAIVQVGDAEPIDVVKGQTVYVS
jgi:hypothetical protein